MLLLGGPGMSRGFLNTGDTNNLVAESRVLMDCVNQHVFRACRFDATLGRSRVGPYPLLQYLPAVAMRGLGLRSSQVLRGLAWLNFGAFVATLGMLGSIAARARQRLWGPLLLVLATSGPLWFYATTGFGEMLAGALVLAMVLACLHRRPVLIGGLALVACLGKETLPPFVLALGLFAGRRDEDGWLPPRRVLVPLVIGVLGGTALSLGFNVFRYGTVRNVRYLQPQFRVAGAGRVSRNILALLAAPGGGLALYWPAMALLLVGLVTVGVIALRGGRPVLAGRVAALLAVLAAYTIGLAQWWAPLGWIAWGPRLFVPLIPALAVVTVHIGGRELAALLCRTLVHPVAFVAIVAVSLIGAFPEVGAAWSPGPAVTVLRTPDNVCPTFGAPGSDLYWRCFDRRAWRLDPTPLRTATAHVDAITWVVRATTLGGLVLLLIAARSEAADGHAMTATMSPEPTV